MWILWNILVGATLAIVVAIMKKYNGPPIKAYFLYIGLVGSTFGWMLPYAYRISPNFMYPYFIQNAVVNVLGIILGKFVFGDSITVLNWIGIVMITIGCGLLINMKG